MANRGRTRWSWRLSGFRTRRLSCGERIVQKKTRLDRPRQGRLAFRIRGMVLVKCHLCGAGMVTSTKTPGPDVALRLGICTEASSDRHVLPVPAVISALSRILKTSSFRRQEEV